MTNFQWVHFWGQKKAELCVGRFGESNRVLMRSGWPDPVRCAMFLWPMEMRWLMLHPGTQVWPMISG